MKNKKYELDHPILYHASEFISSLLNWAHAYADNVKSDDILWSSVNAKDVSKNPMNRSVYYIAL